MSMQQSTLPGPFETILYEKKDAAAYMTLNRPKVMNALNQKAISELRAAFEDARDDPQLRGAPTLEEFLSGLRTAWREDEVRPTGRPKEKAKRGRRRPDPLVAVTAQLHDWFEAEPWWTARELLERLQDEQSGTLPDWTAADLAASAQGLASGQGA
jgi:hypothetical protein